MSPNFEQWLLDVESRFKTLNGDEQNKTLDTLIRACGGSQLYYLSCILDRLVKRDFIELLPKEIAFYLLQFLNTPTLQVCCQVSKQWNTVVTCCKEVWARACMKIGASVSVQPPSLRKPASEHENEHDIEDDSEAVDLAGYYRSLYMRVSDQLTRLEQGHAMDRLLLFGHKERVMALYYRDGYLATGSDDRTVRIWDCSTGHCVKVIQTHTVACVKFNSSHVLTGSFDTTAALWDITTGELIQEYEGHVGAVFTVDYDTELDLLATGSADSTVKIWSLSTGEILTTLPHQSSSWITQVKLCRKNLKQPGDESVKYRVLTCDGSCIYMWQLTDNHSFVSNEQWANLHSELLHGVIVKNDKVTCMTKGALGTCYAIQFPTFNVHSEMQRTSCQLDYRYLAQGFLGCGSQFEVLLVHSDAPTLLVVHKARKKILASIRFPQDYRPSKRGSTYTLGETDWLDGLTGNNEGVFFAASLKDNSVCVLKWKSS